MHCTANVLYYIKARANVLLYKCTDTLQYIAGRLHALMQCSTLQCTVLQNIILWASLLCRTLQHTVTHCRMGILEGRTFHIHIAMHSTYIYDSSKALC